MNFYLIGAIVMFFAGLMIGLNKVRFVWALFIATAAGAFFAALTTGRSFGFAIPELAGATIAFVLIAMVPYGATRLFG